MAGTGLLIKKRMVFLLLVFSLSIIFLLGRFVWLQLVKGNEYRQLAFEQQRREREISPKRGIIYDRNGKELAYSASVERVTINPREFRESCDDVEKAAEELAAILELDRESVLKKINSNLGWQSIKRKIDKDVGNQVRQWAQERELAGVYVDEDSKRFYPYGNLACHVIGFTGTDNEGLEGIEAVMDKYLKGYPGKILSGMDASNRQLPFEQELRIDAQDGLNVVLTIDEAIQHFATRALEKAIADNKVLNGGAAIVMDPRNAEILAMVSKPDYDLNNPWAAPDIPGIDESTWKGTTEEEVDILRRSVWRNKVVADTYEPGSAFKAITAAIALEEGVVTPETPTNDAPVKIGKHTINCWRVGRLHGSMTFKEGVYNSCNPVFVKVAMDIGIEKFYKYVKAFGFYDKTGIELGEGRSIFHKEPREIDLAVASFGQRFQVTPIQMITAYAAIANGGKLLKPRLVKEITDSSGNVVQKFEPEVIRNVISRETSDTLKEILEGVVSKGTGKNAYIEGYRVAGKTATSETTEKGRYIASFAAFAPADNPVVCVLVILDNPTGPYGYYGGVIAGPVVREILEQTLDYLGVERRYTKEEEEKMRQQVFVPELEGLTLAEAKKLLEKNNLRYKIEGEGYTDETKVVQQTPTAGAGVLGKSVVILYTYDPGEQVKVRMPDLLHKTVEEAAEALNRVGLNIRIIGSGEAVRQQYLPGTEVRKGEIVEVEFRHLDSSVLEKSVEIPGIQ